MVRQVDIPCRIGGDEFCILLPRTTIEDAIDVCHRLNTEFARRDTRGVTFSIGVLQTGPREFSAAAALLKRADELMYIAKETHRSQGGARVCAGGPGVGEHRLC